MAIRGEIFSSQVQTEKRTYFFNVKENRNGDVFLQVVESKKTDVDDRRAIVIFAEDMQKFLQGLDDSLHFIEKDHKERAKVRAAKKAEKEAKYSVKNDEDEVLGKKIVRRKGESRLVSSRRAERADDGIKRTGKVIHITSKRKSSEDESY